jgi:hypothetical protein
MDLASEPAPREASLSYLVYLYLWPFWLFRDVRQGSLLEQAAAYRHNRAQRGYLPGYLVKWAILFSVLMAATWGFEQLAYAYWAWAACCTLLAGATGVLATLALLVMVITGVAYLFLCRWKA